MLTSESGPKIPNYPFNKAVDFADECLRRRGKGVEDPSAEVVMMFITHCPDPSLAMSFKLKSPELWTAAEVQERPDSHLTNMRRNATHAQHVVNVSVCSQSPVAVSSPQPQHSESGPFIDIPITASSCLYYHSCRCPLSASVNPHDNEPAPVPSCVPPLSCPSYCPCSRHCQSLWC